MWRGTERLNAHYCVARSVLDNADEQTISPLGVSPDGIQGTCAQPCGRP